MRNAKYVHYLVHLPVTTKCHVLLLHETAVHQAQKFVVINTHKGLYRYTRLPFGISSAPGIFQKTMETVLRGIPRVIVYLDDILISGSTEAEHLKALEEVLNRLATAGLRAKKRNCKFMAPFVEFLGHLVDGDGIRPLPEKQNAH